MKILVLVKQVPERDVALRIEAGATRLDESEFSYETNEPDAYALEAALGLREAQGGEVVALSAGPARVVESLRDALAKGADRAIHIAVDDLAVWDSLALARLLAAAVETEKPDLVLAGLQSDDLGCGQTAVMLAEWLHVPHATLAMALAVEDGRLQVKRELEGGWYQRVTLPLPAVVTVQSGISRLRYATLMGIKRAKGKEIKQLTAASLGVETQPGWTLRRLHAPQATKQTVWIEGSPAEQATRLVERLRAEAKVL